MRTAQPDNRPPYERVTTAGTRDAGAGGRAAVTRWRALWLVVLMFVIFVGVTAAGLAYTYSVEQRDRVRNEEIQRQQDEDMCRLLAALVPGAAPAPSSPYGAAQRAAVSDYRAHRC